MEIRFLSSEDEDKLFEFCSKAGDAGIGQPSLGWIISSLTANPELRIAAVISDRIEAIMISQSIQYFLKNGKTYPSWMIAWMQTLPNCPMTQKNRSALVDLMESYFYSLGFTKFFFAVQWKESALLTERKRQALAKQYNIQTYKLEILKIQAEPPTEDADPIIRIMSFNIKKFPIAICRMMK
jgi:hypothetical protein